MAPSGTSVKLSLPDAEALALKNHPQVQAAQHAVSAMKQRIAETRSAYYPQLAGDSPRRRAIRRRASEPDT